MNFPYHAIPDGNVWAPHHLYIGWFLMLLALFAVWDNQKDEPLVGAALIAGQLFSFVWIWPVYPILGAIMSVAILPLLSLGLYYEREYFAGHRGLAFMYILGLYIAADDILEHAFGWPMPLDVFFKEVMLPVGWYLKDHLFTAITYVV